MSKLKPDVILDLDKSIFQTIDLLVSKHSKYEKKLFKFKSAKVDKKL